MKSHHPRNSRYELSSDSFTFQFGPFLILQPAPTTTRSSIGVDGVVERSCQTDSSFEARVPRVLSTKDRVKVAMPLMR